MMNLHKVFQSLFISCSTLAAQQTFSYLEQGKQWEDIALRQRYWYADQGSKLMPYDWFLKLKKADGSRFVEGLDRYGFVPSDFDPPTPLTKQINPDGLPIGFAIHDDKGRKWVGLTCAACHANRIDYNGKSYIIEGAPSMLNFDAFFSDLVDAIGSPVNSPESAGVTPDELKRLNTTLRARREMNSSPVPAGFARVDAFTQIFNQIAVGALGNDPNIAGVPNAPASYPFLWDIAQHEFLQWNGSAPNLGVGGTGSKLRNVGEVLGVFGEVTVPTPPHEMKYASSVNLPNLLQVESWIETLLPPVWPKEFPQPSQASVQAGEAIYNNECASCHAVLKRGELKYPTPIKMVSVDKVQTDRQLVDNFRLRTAKTNQLEGMPIKVEVKHPFEKFGKEAPVRQLGAHVTIGTLRYLETSSFFQDISDAAKSLSGGTPDMSSYKARPLDGIWATAPYLHNGSVANLDDLLKPAVKRMQTFCVGSFDYDPVKVGFSTTCTGRAQPLDTTKIGNSNSGHEYGIYLQPAEKAQLLDYLKTL